MQYFNTAINYSVNFLHNILEGVAQFEVKPVLDYVLENFITANKNWLIKESFLTIAIPRGELFTMQLSCLMERCGPAIQSGVLRNLPLIFGYLVQRESTGIF